MDADLPGAAAAAAAAPAGPAPAAPPSPAPAEEEEEDVVAGAEKEIAGGDDKMKRKRRRSAVEWWNDLVQATRYEETAADGVVTSPHAGRLRRRVWRVQCGGGAITICISLKKPGEDS